MIRLCLILICLALPARATQDGWPALFDVVDVAADDVLNIREDASAASPILGALAHDETAVEVIRPSPDDGWGLVNTGEGQGWVSLRFLARQPGEIDTLPPGWARCFGTEPFWSLTRDGDAVTLDALSGEGFTAGITAVAGAAGRAGPFAFLLEGESAAATALVAREACSDGMSDNAFGLGVTLITRAPELDVLSGCCSLK